MSSESQAKRFLKALNGEITDRPPIWLMRQAGRYLPEYRETRAKARDFLDLCYSPDLATEVTLQPLRRFDLDAAILFADILLIPDALGQGVAFKEGEGPVLDAIINEEGLKGLSLEGVETHLAPVFETIANLSAALPKDKTLIGFAGSPWTVATYMVGGRGSPDQRAARIWAFRDPAGFAKLVDLVTTATILYLEAQIEAGAEVIQLFDSWAAHLPDREFTRWVITPTARIVAALKKRFPAVPVIGFPRGAGAAMMRYAEETGVSALSLDTGVSAPWARDNLQPKLPVQGNLDPFVLVAGGEALQEEAKRLLMTFRGGPYIFNLGHGIVPETPPEHVGQLVDLVTGWKG
ncbi:uroporphyrinogen decarboxylase [bacterium AH-315-P15]|nr:uroporphyrinogen decarboxylase [bacterium AH-315-P15]